MDLDENLSDQEYFLKNLSIIYNDNGANSGNVPIDNNRYESGSTASVLDNTGNLARVGYGFVGWNTSSSGSGQQYSGFETFIIGDNNVNLYAQWSQNNFSISFDKNDPTTTGLMPNQIIPKNTTANLNSCSFQKTGWSFIGWSTMPTGAIEYTDYSAYNMSTNDVTLYAQWSQNIYSITFDKNDPAATGAMSIQNIAEGYTAQLQDSGFSLSGWEFNGWSKSAGSTVEYQDSALFTMGLSDITLYAQWIENHAIIFDKNDPAAIGSMSEQIITEGYTAQLQYCVFSLSGWEFNGWSTNAGSAVEYQDSALYTMGISDITLYAQWIEKHTITFDKNDPAAFGSMSEQIITEGYTAQLQDCGFSLNGWEFNGWSTSAGSAVEYQDSAFYTMGMSDITLYAQWIENHAITFDKNDPAAVGSMSEQIITEGYTSQLQNCGFSMSGWEFNGWSTSAGGSVSYQDGSSYTMGISDITLYAQWSPVWTIVGRAGFSTDSITFTSIAIGPTDTPYIAYNEYNNSSKATVMNYDGSDWITVGTAGFSAGNISYPSLAIDSLDTPCVLFTDGVENSLATVMEYDGANWINLGSAGFSEIFAYNASLAFDHNDIPYVAYGPWVNTHVATMKKFNGTAWTTVGPVDFTENIAEGISFAFDSNNTLYVAFSDISKDRKLTVMKFNDTDWVNVGTAGFSTSNAYLTVKSLAIDSEDTIYVSYRDDSNVGKATVMKYDGTNWITIGTAGFSDGYAYNINLAIDSNNFLYVAYMDDANERKATVMQYSGLDWTIVGRTGFSPGIASYSSLAIDSQNTLYVSFQDSSSNARATVMMYKNP